MSKIKDKGKKVYLKFYFFFTLLTERIFTLTTSPCPLTTRDLVSDQDGRRRTWPDQGQEDGRAAGHAGNQR